MICRQCHAVLPDSANYCLRCGSAQSALCPNCRETLKAGASTCFSCGAVLPILGLPSRGLEDEAHDFQRTSTLVERRQMTILFCDLVNSSGLSDRLDPEDLHEVMLAYQQACQAAVTRFEGTVIRIVGDGILCSFGYPRTHEDDPERAIHAGLVIVERVSGLPSKDQPPLEVRIGIATGMVVVSDVVDAAASDIFGSPPIFAVRLQALAEPGTLAVADSTRQLVGHVFRFDDLGWHRLKGFADRVRAWRVLGAGDVNNRFEVSDVHGKLPSMVDRDGELALLLERFRRAERGDGQAILLEGEPGIGKSRLLRAFRDQLASIRFVYLYCSPYHRHSTLHPFAAMLERIWRLSDSPDVGGRIAIISSMLARAEQPPEIATPVVVRLLSIDCDGESRLSPQREREVLFDAILGQLFTMAEGRPAVIVLENAHWIDPTSQDLLELLIERCRKKPVVVIVTYRPEWRFDRDRFAHVSALNLDRLERDHCLAIARNIAGETGLEEAMLGQIAEKADGVPLFLEEITKSVLVTKTDQAAGADAGGGRLHETFVPATLRDSLMARLDRLNAAREIVQVGAVIGREFSFEVIAAITEAPESHLAVALDQLVEAGILFRSGVPPKARYFFKHALLQDVAYSSLLRRKRRRLHTAIVNVFEARASGPTLEETALLARHCVEAGLPEKAAGYFFELGQAASRRSANIEAIAHFRNGLETVKQLPADERRKRQTLRFLIALGPTVISTHGPGSAEADAVYREAIELSDDLPDSELTFAAHWGRWRISMDLRMGREWADRLLDIAYRLDDPGLKLQAHHCQWATLFNVGAQQACARHVEQGLQFYDPERHRYHAVHYGGHDPRVCGYGELALSQWLLGLPAQARVNLQRAEAWAAELEHAGSTAHAMDFAIMLHRYRRDPRAVRQQADRMMAFAGEQSLRDHEVKALFFRGWADGFLGEPVVALDSMQRAMAMQETIGTAEDFPVYYDMLAEMHQRLGRWPEALDALERGFAAARDSGLGYWNPELYRRRAELRRQSGQEPEAARADLQDALRIAREQGARLLELRAAMTAVRLADDDRPAWLAALRSIFGSFAEGREEVDLKEAAALLGASDPLRD